MFQQLYLLNSRKDLISKLNLYTNINKISYIRYINLSFLELKNKLSVILALAFLYLIGNKKGKLNIKSRFNFSKMYGCFLRLKREEALFFIEKFLFLNIKDILDLEEGFSQHSFSKVGSFSFTIKDIYSFSELGESLFKVRNLKNLNIVILFSNQNILENKKLLQSLGFSFKG